MVQMSDEMNLTFLLERNMCFKPTKMIRWGKDFLHGNLFDFVAFRNGDHQKMKLTVPLWG